MKKVLIITGLTGCGKTKLSIPLAKKFNTDIINGDAFQVYKKMNILTAKIKEDEKEGIKHHLLDIIEPTSEYSVAQYQKDVRYLIDELHKLNKLPIIVGGSGLYINSVIYDYQFKSQGRTNDPSYDNLSNEELHQILLSLDPTSASKIHPNNRKRVERAIELAKDKTIVNDFNDTLVYDALIIFLEDDRDKAYEAINKRVDLMMEEGLLEEVKSLLNDNLSETAKKAIGLKELIPYFNGECTIDEAIEKIKQNTRHLAKRQITWFNKQKNTIHIKVNRNNFNETIDEVLKIVNDWYKEEL